MDGGAVGNAFGGVGHRNGTRQAQLAADDDGVADLTAHVHDDPVHGEEERRPRRVGQRGDHDVAGLQVRGIGGVDDDAGPTGDDTRATRGAGQGVARCGHPGARVALASPRVERRDLAVADEERWLELPQLGPVRRPLRHAVADRGRVRDELVELVGCQHEDVVGIGERAGFGMAAAQLARRHPDLVEHPDERGLGPLPVHHHVAAHEGGFEHAGHVVVTEVGQPLPGIGDGRLTRGRHGGLPRDR